MFRRKSIDDDDDPSTPCVIEGQGQVTTAVQAEVTLNLDIDSLTGPTARAEFDLNFATDIATLLSIDAARVQVTSVSGGSVVVAFTVIPAPDGTSLSPTVLQAAFSSGTVSLAAVGAEHPS